MRAPHGSYTKNNVRTMMDEGFPHRFVPFLWALLGLKAFGRNIIYRKQQVETKIAYQISLQPSQGAKPDYWTESNPMK